jgi:ABC-type branched-subunit amino acid transport system substrate-binding protein
MKREWVVITVCIALAVAFLSTVPVLAETPGVTETEIKIGTSAGLTGPIAVWGNRMARIGPQTYFNHINEQGGVHGRKLTQVLLDDGYQPPRSVANHKRLIESEKVFAILLSMGTPTVSAAIQTILDNEVPLLFPATGAHKWGYEYRPYVFQASADYWHMSAVMVDYIVKEKGLKKWGVFYQDDDYGKDVLNGTIAQLKKHGLEVVATETYKRGSIDVSGQVAKLRAADVEVVMLGTVYREGAPFLREKEKVGWNVQTVGIAPTATQTFVDLCGSSGLGHLNTFSNPSVDADRPGVLEFRSLMQKYFADEKISEEALYGYIAAKTFVAGLQAAGRELTRESLIKGLESLKDYDNGITDLITFGPEDHQGVTASYISTIVEDTPDPQTGAKRYKYTQVTDWIKPAGY